MVPWWGEIPSALAQATNETVTADFFVAVDGDDSHPGTLEAPVATMERARDLVRAARTVGPPGDKTVLLRGGTHFLAKSLEFRAEDSAPTGHTTTYAAYPGEKVLLSGGQPIRGWRRAGKLLQTTVPEVRDGAWFFRELFVNGQRATRARTPNEGFYRVVKPGTDRRTSFQFQSGDLHAWPEVRDAEIVFFHDWSTSQVRLESVDEQTRTVWLVDPIGRSMPHYEIGHFEPHPRYYVENARPFLDQPGEWYLDASTGELSYWPRSGEELDSLVAVAPRLTALMVVHGDSKGCRHVEGLQWEGLHFAYCRWDVPEKGLAMGQACTYEDRSNGAKQRSPLQFMPAAVSFDWAMRCAVINCRFEHLGLSGLQFRETCLHNHILDNVFRDIAGNGINLGESPHRGRRYDCPSLRDYPNALSRGNVIRGNLVERCGALYSSGVGIWIGIAAETTVEDNQLRHLPYSGISLGWRWKDGDSGCQGNLLRGNHIHHVMQVLSDGGGIYTLGNQPGAVISNNRIHDIPANAGRAESNGIFFDETSALIRVEGNEIFHVAKSPLRFHRAHDVAIVGNRLSCQTDVPPWRFQGCQKSMMTFQDNVILEDSALLQHSR